MFDNFKVQTASEAFESILKPVQPENVRESLYDALFKRPDSAVTAVSEEGYLDIDYSSSFFLQQGRSFTPVPRRTWRIHMFSSHFDQKQFENASAETIEALAASYLGYIVVRPFRPPTIGRTFIKPPQSI